MKKLVIAVAVFMSVGTMAFAQSNDSMADNQVATQVVQDAFKEVKLENLGEKVQAAVNAYNEAYTVKKLELDEAQKLARVTLEDKSTKSEKVVVLDEEGKEVK